MKTERVQIVQPHSIICQLNDGMIKTSHTLMRSLHSLSRRILSLDFDGAKVVGALLKSSLVTHKGCANFMALLGSLPLKS